MNINKVKKAQRDVEMLQSALTSVHGGLDTVETVVETAEEVRRGVSAVCQARAGPRRRRRCGCDRAEGATLRRPCAELNRAGIGLTDLSRSSRVEEVVHGVEPVARVDPGAADHDGGGSLPRSRKCHPGWAVEGLPMPCVGEEAATSDVHHDRL